MEEQVKVYVVGESKYYANWIDNCKLTNNLEEAQIVLFTGGEDVDPSLYGKKPHLRTYSNIERDKEEKEIFDKIDKEHQIAVGICRGSQFMSVMNGGLLIQHCTNHAIAGTHRITDGERIVDITSTHHQMQYPFNLNRNYYDMLYWAYGIRSDVYEGDGIKYIECEPEIVKYQVPGKPICLGIQGHPEIMRKNAPVINILNELVKSCLEDLA